MTNKLLLSLLVALSVSLISTNSYAKVDVNKSKLKVIKPLKKYPPSSPNELLGTAIRNSNDINDYVPQKSRLDLYEKVTVALNRIVNEHPGSTQAIQILSRQSIGEFNPATIRTKYIAELSDYYDKICEVTFSAKCLGFVSLKTGTDECKTARGYLEAISAHEKILNAAKFFISQDEKDTYISLALNEYRKCTSRFSYTLSRPQTEYFNVLLLDVMLSVDQVGTAKAIIQNMKTPYYKFEGVMKLRLHRGIGLDVGTIQSLKNYIDNDIAKPSDRAISHILLTTEIARRPIPKGLTQTNSRKGVSLLSEIGKYHSSTIPAAQQEYFLEILSNLQSVWWSNQNNTVGMSYLVSSWKWSKQRKNISNIYGLLLPRGQKPAEEFLTRSVRENWSLEDMQFYLMPKLSTTEAVYRDAFKQSGSASFDKVFNTQSGRFLKFKKEVDYGNICKSANVLFNTLKKTKYYNDAIKYMIESSSVNPELKYECGDEELQLLLS